MVQPSAVQKEATGPKMQIMWEQDHTMVQQQEFNNYFTPGYTNQ